MIIDVSHLTEPVALCVGVILYAATKEGDPQISGRETEAVLRVIFKHEDVGAALAFLSEKLK